MSYYAHDSLLAVLRMTRSSEASYNVQYNILQIRSKISQSSWWLRSTYTFFLCF